jgi:hypothetical protein
MVVPSKRRRHPDALVAVLDYLIFEIAVLVGHAPVSFSKTNMAVPKGNMAISIASYCQGFSLSNILPVVSFEEA